MKLKLNKKKLKNLSKDNKSLPADMTPMIAGGNGACFGSDRCLRDQQPIGGNETVAVTW
ncbi:hypothetical protein [Pseudoalteromonas denitrificans]|uniref:Uncharacterized protein n=1 Tax=Pseudoalteromonas denitrificans DSM 6059 TaxID=1123010 RepID=A0A1I1IAR4_9GAMM|nr:hypothetical protein [Pseudoalteromonas denitrificans]SFC30873.1 hypothetical protein SAMN02745724_01365 [Pseudoalteromonas denitrificans DSM 6059]